MSILQTALTNSRLRLELDYREPSRFPDGDTGSEERLEIDLAVRRADQRLSAEFACLLSVI